MRTTVRLNADLLRAAKIKAAQEGRTLTSLLEEGVRRVLAEDGPSASAGDEGARLAAPAAFEDRSVLTKDFRETGIDIDNTSAVLAWLDEQAWLAKRSGDP